MLWVGQWKEDRTAEEKNELQQAIHETVPDEHHSDNILPYHNHIIYLHCCFNFHKLTRLSLGSKIICNIFPQFFPKCFFHRSTNTMEGVH